MMDSYHMNLEERDNEQALRTIGKRLVHVQVSDNYRGCPGKGQVRWDTFKRGVEICQADAGQAAHSRIDVSGKCEVEEVDGATTPRADALWLVCATVRSKPSASRNTAPWNGAANIPRSSGNTVGSNTHAPAIGSSRAFMRSPPP